MSLRQRLLQQAKETPISSQPPTHLLTMSKSIYDQEIINNKPEPIPESERITESESWAKFDDVRPTDILDELTKKAHSEGFKLLKLLDAFNSTKLRREKIKLQIATTESLTGGLIFSTLVDIPFGGQYKYGAFAVYDTDAKRVFNNVSVEDVYTHECAKQMAVGLLLNSNATVAISVTGNAMPAQEDPASMRKLGEVFIGVATYINNDGIVIPDGKNKLQRILVETKVINICNIKDANIENICKLWYTTVENKKELKTVLEDYDKLKQPSQEKAVDRFKYNLISGFNDMVLTSLISNCIRQYTAYEAFNFCHSFLDKHLNDLIIPEFISNDKEVIDRTKLIELQSTKNSEYINNNILLDSRQGFSIKYTCVNEETCVDKTRNSNAEYKYQKKYMLYKKKYLELKNKLN